jgi:two-component system, OmpR family, sensor kinase
MERVQTSQQSQRDFIANVSHELKTPITSIQGFAQAILDGTVQTPELLKQSANVIYNEAGRMHRLVMDLLALSRLEAGTADLQYGTVDIGLVLENVVSKFQLQAKQLEINLMSDLKPIPPFWGDGDRLAQVFTNLMDNALKFTPQGGQVHVNSGIEARNIVVKVADTGCGIPPKDLSRIFERFYQVDKSRKGGSGRGIGLGLAIVKQIVLAHKGKIKIESEQGNGTTFSVILPIIQSKDITPFIDKGKH